MGVFCLLLDKKKRYSSLLADIFSVTGHRLLIAFDENRARELYDASKPEVILLDISHMDFWLELIKEKRYMIPVFFVNSHEEGEELLKKGLSEYNYSVLPFNPLELLSKLVNLVKVESIAHETGLVSLLIRLVMRGHSAFVEVRGEGKTCQIYVKDGKIRGLSCPIESLLHMINGSYKLRLGVYDETKAKVEYELKDDWELFSALLAPEEIPVASKIKAPLQEEEKEEGVPLFDQPLEIAPDLFWVGIIEKEGLLQKNSYLYVCRKGDLKIPILINVWTPQDYTQIRAKVEQVLGNIDSLRAIVVLGSSVDECAGIVNFLQESKRAYVITSISIYHKLMALGIPRERIRAFETFPNGRLKLATGNFLRFIHAPFLPEAGSFVMLEEDKGYLFTGRFLSSFSTAEEFNPQGDASLEDLLLFNSLIVPSSIYLKKTLEELRSASVSHILPAFGNPILSPQKAKRVLERLELISLLEPEAGHIDHILSICSSVLEDIGKSIDPSDFQVLLEALSLYMSFQEGRIKELYVNPQTLPSLILGVLIEKGINPKVIKKVLHRFYSARVPFTI